MRNDRFHSILGLAKKAGKLVSGSYSVEKYLKTRKVFLVVIAEDFSKRSSEKFIKLCEDKKVPYLVYSNKRDLGRAIGREIVGIIAITDEGFMKLLKEAAKGENYGGE
ncbi:MAG: Ribosomal protein HS6-type [Caldanaerobacter subterraneus]|uniref:50S ribosomal protein L7ae n=1 Tax=Caldanaerobacter subterraneus TaxID=911092 RepID=A0A124FCV4_9THEO|nr:ribosomal L7Ae/L30e/S12e/Gadd45 family protein [Caldanaerobacter subterraneus]KUK09834.1 MAG: Ribosomal protein HS6-type [Caldanaerobacter subterraneus]HBT49378.1 50S ribosomal protein L7ae [Caldanaerobacter subterraneus]